MRPLGVRRDPAPSRLAYRLHRWLLTPLFRWTLTRGLPLALIAGAGAAWISDPVNRETVTDRFAEIRAGIEARPEFAVKVMAVDGASDAVAAEIRDVAAVDLPVSSFDLDLPAIRARVASIDAVSGAEVRVRAGGVLQIDVTERVPAVVLRSETGLELLDEGGRRVTALGARGDRADLPLIAGLGAETAVPEALRLYEAAGPVRDRLRGFLRVGERRWDVVLDRGQRILLPEDDAAAALEQVMALDAARDLLSRDITVVDMRLPHRPTLRLAPGAVDELRRIRTLSFGAD